MTRQSDEQLIDLTEKLVAIESTTQNPTGLREAYDFMVAMVRAAGKQITIEEFESNGRPSFLAYTGTRRPDTFHIIFNGHIDVVPGSPQQFQMRRDNGKLYGRGVYDMKAACVILADAFCEMVDKVPFALGLQIVTDEENAGRDGTLHQIQHGVRADFVICGECGRHPSMFEIANEAKGIVVAKIHFKGSTSHGAYPWQGDNPAAKAAEFIQSLHTYYPIPTEPADHTTMTVTSLSAQGAAPTKTPGEAYITLDARYVAGDPHFIDKPTFEAHIRDIDASAEVVDYIDFSSPLYTHPGDALLQTLKTAAERIECSDFTLVRRHATSDGRFYGNIGTSACEFGIAGEHQHGDDEHITVDAFRNYRATVNEFLGETAKREATRLSTAKSSDQKG